MFDAPARRVLERPLGLAAAALDRPWISPTTVTLTGLALGLGSAGTAALQWWWLALALWLLSRLADGLDGSLARRRGTTDAGAGGLLDISADFAVYAATVLGVAQGAGGSRWPYLLVLVAYYLNGSGFLAFSSLAERTGRQVDDGRSLSFIGGLAEGGETIAVHSAWLVFHGVAGGIALGWGAYVLVGAVARIVAGYRALR